MNNAMAHAPLSSEGHIGIMTDGLPSRNTCGFLHQLQVWWLQQCGGHVVCSDGLKGSLKPLLFNFKELPLWSMANADESAIDPTMIEVNLVLEVPPPTRAEDPLGLNLRGTLEQLWWAPHHPPLSLAVHHFQDTNTVSSPGISSPSRAN